MSPAWAGHASAAATKAVSPQRVLARKLVIGWSPVVNR
jgi:hypothetical protein